MGILLSLCLSVPLGSLTWFNNNPSLAEIEQGVAENMNLTAAESERVRQMMAVGAVIDFSFNLFLFTFPAAIIGAILGVMGGLFWIRYRYPTGI